MTPQAKRARRRGIMMAMRNISVPRVLGRAVLIVAILGLAACSRNNTPELMRLTSGNDGPDEFAIVPSKPLAQPEDFAALPPPTPGGVNRADATPEADVVAALGGRPETVSPSSADGALVRHAGRFGTSATIREDLAAADLEFRQRNNGRFLDRVFNRTVYFDAYEPLELDQHSELDRFRRAGARTPSAPPQFVPEQ